MVIIRLYQPYELGPTLGLSHPSKKYAMSLSILEPGSPLDMSTDPFLDHELSPLPPSSIIQSSSSITDTSIKKRPRTSLVWEHMPDSSETVYHKGEWIYWRCRYCPREYRESGGTTVIANHLKTHEVHNKKKSESS
ncbi:hypothetical protein F5884DRAFT_533969 [Xylogone sp. PMI_703]|nr:hypothetical protein F5884DRAFT_533969 [Xylogone sp. PMI_703]